MQEIRVWDYGIRFFHWALVITLAVSWISIDLLDAVEVHALSGWAICSLLLFRILWGLIVWPKYANFLHMYRTLKSLKPYIRQLLKKKGDVYLGHNPLGVIAVIVMLGLIILQVGSGLVMTDDITLDGPLYAVAPQWVISLGALLHEVVFNLLLLVIVLHIAAIALYTLYKKQRIVPAMLHGTKRLDTDTSAVDQAGNQQINLWILLRMLLASALTIYISFALFKVWL